MPLARVRPSSEPEDNKQNSSSSFDLPDEDLSIPETDLSLPDTEPALNNGSAVIQRQGYLEDLDPHYVDEKELEDQLRKRRNIGTGEALVAEGFTNLNVINANDLLKNSYEKYYKPLEGKVLETKSWLQNILTERNLSEDIGQARSQRGEKYREMKNLIDQLITSYFAQPSTNIRTAEAPVVTAMVTNEILGLGPIEPLWLDSRISEIMVNGPEHVYVEIKGKLLPVPGAKFRDQEHLLEVSRQILSPIGRTIDIANSYEDGRLPDGSRINITHPVIGPKGPNLTIRRFPETVFNVEELVRLGSMTEEMAVTIGNLIHKGCSVVIVGGTGTGKTSMLNALSGCIPSGERIITIEDNLELQLHPDRHVVALEARKAHHGDNGAVSIRDLVRNSLRMRPDRIVVGEVRDGSAYDMLQAMNTGHDGSMTTVHANDALGGVNRLINLMSEVGDIDTPRMFSLISGGVDIMVVIDRFTDDGSRRVASINEIPPRVDVDKAGNPTLTPRVLYEFVQTDLIYDEEGQPEVVGEYRSVDPISSDLNNKHRLSKKTDLTLDEIYKLSQHGETAKKA